MPLRMMSLARALLALSIGLAFAAPAADAKTVREAKTAKSGKSQKIDAYSGWNPDCSFLAIDLKVVNAPDHGSVSPRVEMGKIHQAQAGSAGKCLGKPTRTLAVYYRSNKGFRGTDTFTVRMLTRGQPAVDFVYTVTVR